MLLFVYATTYKRFVIFTCRYFKLRWNTTALSQSNCRNFSCSSIMRKMKTTDCFAVQFMGGKKIEGDSGKWKWIRARQQYLCVLDKFEGFQYVLQFCNPDTISCNSVIPTVIFCIPPPKPAYFQSQIPSFTDRKAFLPPDLAGSTFLQWTPWLAQPGQLSQGEKIRACASAVGLGKRVNVFLEKHSQKLARPARRMTHFCFT